MDALLHFWRCIGYLLGIEDKYNLCSGTYDEIKSVCDGILQKEMKLAITNSPPIEAVEMSRGIVYAVKSFIRTLTWEAFSKYLFEVIEIEREFHLTLFTSCSYYAMRFTFNYLLHFFLLTMFFNSLLRFALVLVNWRKKSLMKSLEKKYKESFETLQHLCLQDVEVLN